MKTQSIQQIEECIKQVEHALKDFVIRQHQDERYGVEEEYTPKALKGGIVAILTDLRGLVKAHQKFVQLSTHGEREAIHGYLGNIVSSLTENNYSGVVDHLDHVKTILRNYSIRSSSETQNVLEERANRLNAQCSIVEESIDTIGKIKKKAEQAKARLGSAEEGLESLDNILNELQNKSSQTENLQNQSQQNHQVIENLLASAKSHEGNMDSFVKKIQARVQQLGEQERITTSYQEKLISFEEEHTEKLQTTAELINQARNALGYKTAEGISAAFNERYLEERIKGIASLIWLLIAILFIFYGIIVGIGAEFRIDTAFFHIKLPSLSDKVHILTRIAIMSTTFSGAWFCAAQYVRSKNTRDDYGYKSVLAKSMVAFLDQFQIPEERKYYLQTVLSQIHQDPLRKKHDVDTPASNLFRVFQRKEKPATQTKGLENNE